MITFLQVKRHLKMNIYTVSVDWINLKKYNCQRRANPTKLNCNILSMSGYQTTRSLGWTTHIGYYFAPMCFSPRFSNTIYTYFTSNALSLFIFSPPKFRVYFTQRLSNVGKSNFSPADSHCWEMCETRISPVVSFLVSRMLNFVNTKLILAILAGKI